MILNATDVEKDEGDVFYRNDLLLNNVAGTSWICKHGNKEYKITSNLQTVQGNEKKRTIAQQKEKERECNCMEENQSEENTRKQMLMT